MAKYTVTVKQTMVEQCEVEVEADSMSEAAVMTDQFADEFVDAARHFVGKSSKPEILRYLWSSEITDRQITRVDLVAEPKTKHACSCGESDCVWCGA
jgi:hypothetical protein|tara:strand:+ start:580 stop:870 length:291 start_codon:yes stop_codon:yes gene_type:complete